MPAPAAPSADVVPDIFRLEGSVPARTTPFSYQVGLALSALAMVLLPLIYVGMIALLAYGIYYYAITATALLHSSGSFILKAVGYAGPLVIGTTVLVFMIKPLFAGSRRTMAPATLDLNQQPQLQAMIAAICRAVGSPMPVRVDVDCDVNASARLRRGLLSIGRNDLVLTIGLPLAGALNARQLAGVLAHEFGHFTQGSGMAATYVIRVINHWFARVVFERDSWDEALAAWARDFEGWTGLISHVARGAVWCTRRILHGLMHVGHAIACLQMRNMEFDADHYGIHVGGTEDFLATSRELERLGLASQISFEELGEFWRTKHLVDDFPGFVIRRRALLAEAFAAAPAKPEEPAQTRWFDTHPAPAERASHARALNAPGIFQSNVPASALFNAFEDLCREASGHYYREGLELEFDAHALIPCAVAIRPWEDALLADQARSRLAGTVLDLNRPVLWTAADFSAPPPAHDDASLRQFFQTLRGDLARLRAAAEAEAARHMELREAAMRARAGREFFAANVEIDPSAFGLGSRDASAATARIAELQSQRTAAPALREFEAALHRWAAGVVQAARYFSLPGDLEARIEQTAGWLTRFEPWFREFPISAAEQELFAISVAHETLLDRQRNFTLLGTQCETLRRLAASCAAAMADVPWPFAPAHAPEKTGQKLERALANRPPVQHLAICLGHVAHLYFGLVGRLAAQGEELEHALGVVTPASPAGAA